jgi:hypothetical protein
MLKQDHEFKVSLGYTARLSQKEKKRGFREEG